MTAAQNTTNLPTSATKEEHPQFDVAGREAFDWDNGEYTKERRLLFGLGRIFLYGITWLLSVIGILIALAILKRTGSYELLTPAFPENIDVWTETARGLLFVGGISLVWSTVLLLIEVIPMAIYAWCKRVRQSEVPGTAIVIYAHIFDATWEIGTAIFALTSANLARLLFPPPLVVEAAIPQALTENTSSELAKLLKMAEESEPPIKEKKTLEAIRVWLKQQTKVAKQEPVMDASRHLFAIVKNLSAMNWQMRITRATYMLSVFFCLKLVVKLVMSYTSDAFHKRTVKQRLHVNQQALNITKKLRQKLLPVGTHYKHVDMGSILFDKLCPRGMDMVTISELKEFLPADEAAIYMEFIDLDGNGDISREEFVVSVQGFYSERDNLSCSLSGNSRIIDQLASSLSACVWFISFLTMLVLLDETVTSTLRMVGGAMLSLTFVFGGTAADAFQSIIFILLSHPFDVGDSIFIEDKWYKVLELGLWTCTYMDGGGSTTYICNKTIRRSKISNRRRSGHQMETITVKFDSSTTDKMLEQLEKELSSWVKQNDRDFEPDSFRFNKVTMMDRDRISVEMEITHKSNFQDGGVKRKRTRAFFFNFRDTIERLGISVARPVE